MRLLNNSRSWQFFIKVEIEIAAICHGRRLLLIVNEFLNRVKGGKMRKG
jgi:hypothetical protein